MVLNHRPPFCSHVAETNSVCNHLKLLRYSPSLVLLRCSFCASQFFVPFSTLAPNSLTQDSVADVCLPSFLFFLFCQRTINRQRQRLQALIEDTTTAPRRLQSKVHSATEYPILVAIAVQDSMSPVSYRKHEV